MSNIIKRPSLDDLVMARDTLVDFSQEPRLDTRSETEKMKPELSEEDEVYLKTVDIYADAIAQAEEILNKAKAEAEELRIAARTYGRKEGYEVGHREGFHKAYNDHKNELDQEIIELRRQIRDTIEDVTIQKDKILEKYIDDLKKVTLAIAEKVIQTSLKSSGEVVKRMIVAATAKLKKTQWVKVYVAKDDEGTMLQGDVGLLNELAHLSGNIKIIAMEQEDVGTCIIELPEEIIDVSVSTQLENIKDILNNARA